MTRLVTRKTVRCTVDRSFDIIAGGNAGNQLHKYERSFQLNRLAINTLFHGKFDDHRPRERKIFACDFAFNDGVSADFSQIYLV